MKKEFQLPEEDEKYLNSTGLSWETIIDNKMQWVIIYDYPIDMAYFFPEVKRLDNKPINATCIQKIDNKTFQRWSRHRTAANPWREGIDDISTHLLLVGFWFEQEFIKNPNAHTA